MSSGILSPDVDELSRRYLLLWHKFKNKITKSEKTNYDSTKSPRQKTFKESISTTFSPPLESREKINLSGHLNPPKFTQNPNDISWNPLVKLTVHARVRRSCSNRQWINLNHPTELDWKLRSYFMTALVKISARMTLCATTFTKSKLQSDYVIPEDDVICLNIHLVNQLYYLWNLTKRIIPWFLCHNVSPRIKLKESVG
jgi:hypothetical protein